MKNERNKAAEARSDYEAWFGEQVRLGLEDIEAGRVVSDEQATERMRRLRESLREAADGEARAA